MMTPEEALEAQDLDTSIREADAARAEREAIVAWIRRFARERCVLVAHGIASAIEDGEHHIVEDDGEE